MSDVRKLFIARAIVFLVLLLPVISNAATLSILPTNASVTAGSDISVSIKVSSSDSAMNAASGVLTFPTDLLQVSSIQIRPSIIGLWVQEPHFSNSAGTVNFEGVALNPGFTGSNGNVITVTFHALQPGNAALAINDGSVLANDGNGTELLTSSSGSSIVITEGKKESPPQKTPPPETKPPQKMPETVVMPSTTIATVTPVFVPKTFIEEPVPFSRALTNAISGNELLLQILALILACMLFIWRTYAYIAAWKRSRKDDASRVQELVHEEFKDLKDAIVEEVHSLERVRSKRDLTEEERRIIGRFSKMLDKSERTIERGIEDVSI